MPWRSSMHVDDTMLPIRRYSQYGYGNAPYPTEGQTFNYNPDQPGEGAVAEPADG